MYLILVGSRLDGQRDQLVVTQPGATFGWLVREQGLVEAGEGPRGGVDETSGGIQRASGVAVGGSPIEERDRAVLEGVSDGLCKRSVSAKE